MPLYDYRCPKCSYTEEVLLSIKSEAPPCPKCGETMKVKFSPFTFKFAGYPKWVGRMDDYQKRQADAGIEPTLPHPKDIM